MPITSKKSQLSLMPARVAKIIVSLLGEKDLPLTIGVITYRVRKRIGAYTELRKHVRSAVAGLFDTQKIDRVYMEHYRSQLTGVSLSPKWGYRIPREKWYYGG